MAVSLGKTINVAFPMRFPAGMTLVSKMKIEEAALPAGPPRT